MTKSDPRGIRTLAHAHPNPSESGHFSPPLNALTASSTNPLPPPAPDLTAPDVRSEAGAAPPSEVAPRGVRPGEMRTSELLRRAASIMERCFASDGPAHVAVAGELRARAWVLDNQVTHFGPGQPQNLASALDVLRAIGEVRS